MVQRGIPAANKRLGSQGQRDIKQPTHLWAKEVRWGYANHGEWHALDPDGRANRVKAPTKVSLPERVADNHDRTIWPRKAHIVSSGKDSAEQRRHSKRGEEVAIYEQPLGWLSRHRAPGSCARRPTRRRP